MNVPRLLVVDSSKARHSGIEQLCGEATHVQRCRIHKVRKVIEHLPKAKADQSSWVIAQSLKSDADVGIQKLKAHAKHLKAQHPNAAASLLEGFEESCSRSTGSA